jgi:hypothetical protein
VMCKIWCSIGARKCWHTLPTLQICDYWLLHVGKNKFSENNLNRKAISTLLSLPLYIVSIRMNTELKTII